MKAKFWFVAEQKKEFISKGREKTSFKKLRGCTYFILEAYIIYWGVLELENERERGQKKYYSYNMVVILMVKKRKTQHTELKEEI